tara:strand:+ start:444 stop:1220 length:777 start_codon:yes stop_codon:yes gene_type:complete
VNELEKKFEALVEIVKKLRSPNGCPWDIEQTSQSLIPFFIEEVYEVIEAIDNQDWGSVKEELGDVMLHLIFQALIAEEQKKFKIHDSIDSINEKLVRRHPHVFEKEKADNSFQAKQNWESAKHIEKKRKSRIDGVPKALPSIIQAQRLQQKASYSGFDWKNSKDVWKKIDEEIEELKTAEKDGDIKQIEGELGDAIFSLVNLARFLNISAENALRKTNDKFKNRFRYIEGALEKEGKKFEQTKLSELDKYWNEAKGNE